MSGVPFILVETKLDTRSENKTNDGKFVSEVMGESLKFTPGDGIFVLLFTSRVLSMLFMVYVLSCL